MRRFLSFAEERMKAFTALLFLLLAACHNGQLPFVAPAPSEVLSMEVQLYNRPDGGADIVSFEAPKTSHASILGTLDGAQRDNHPKKWKSLGDIEITLGTGSVDVSVFSTGKGRGAFRVDGTYYRGGSDADFIQLISTAKRERGDRGGAERPAIGSGSESG